MLGNMKNLEENINTGSIAGMGAVTLPTATQTGSGDVPANSGDAEEEYEKKKKKKKMKKLQNFESFVSETKHKLLVTEELYNVIDKKTGEVISDEGPFKKDFAKKFAAKKVGWVIKLVESALTEGKVKQFTTDLKDMIKDIKRGYGWIDPEYVEDTWENTSNSIDFELVKSEIYRQLIKAGLLAKSDDDNEEEAGEYIKSLKQLGISESEIVDVIDDVNEAKFFRLPKKLNAMWELKNSVDYIVGKHDNGDDYNPSEMKTIEEFIKKIKKSVKSFNDADEVEGTVYESLVNEAKAIKVTKKGWPYVEFKIGSKKHKVEFDFEDIIDDHGNEGQDQYWLGKDDDGKEWSIDVYTDYNGDVQDVHYDTIVAESLVNEAKDPKVLEIKHIKFDIELCKKSKSASLRSQFNDIIRSGQGALKTLDESLVTEKFKFSKKEVEAAANLIASAISQADMVKAKVHDLEYVKGKGAGFEISIDGEKYDGGSYTVKDNGDVVNAAIGNKHPNAVYNTIGNKDIADVFINMEKYESLVSEAKFKIGDRVSVLGRSSKKPFDSGEVTGIQRDGTILINGLETISHEVAIDAELVVKESVVNEAKFVKEFNKEVLDAKTKEEVTKLYPNAKFYVGKSDHFFGDLEDNLFFKAYYTKAQKEFEIKSVYSEKGSKYVHLYNESIVNEAATKSAGLVQFAADEKAEGKNAEIHLATFDGSGMEAQSTNKTWDDGVPVTKNFTRGGYKRVAPKGEVYIIESDNWWYFTYKAVWYAVKRKDYGTPPFEY